MVLGHLRRIMDIVSRALASSQVLVCRACCDSQHGYCIRQRNMRCDCTVCAPRPVVAQPQALSRRDFKRQKRLARAAAGPKYAVTQEKVKTSHTFHLLMTCFTFGLWAPVWFLTTVGHKAGPGKKQVTRYR